MWGCCCFYLSLLLYICRTPLSLQTFCGIGSKNKTDALKSFSPVHPVLARAEDLESCFSCSKSILTALVSQTSESTLARHSMKVCNVTKYLSLPFFFLQKDHNEKGKTLNSFSIYSNPALPLGHVSLTRRTSCGCLSCISNKASAADSVFLLSAVT